MGALVAEIVRRRVPPAGAAALIDERLGAIEANHRQKFRSDVLAELKNLDAARIAGLGITRAELDRWLALRDRGT